jgi:hypothetical protein
VLHLQPPPVADFRNENSGNTAQSGRVRHTGSGVK